MKYWITFLFLLPSISFADQLGNYTKNLQFVFHANEGIGNVLYDYSPNKSSAIIQNSGHVWETGKNGFQLNNNGTADIAISSSLAHRIHANSEFTFYMRFYLNAWVGGSGTYNSLVSVKTAADNKWSTGYYSVTGKSILGMSANCSIINYSLPTNQSFYVEEYYDIFITYKNKYITMFGRRPFSNKWENRQWIWIVSRLDPSNICTTNPKDFIIAAYDSTPNNPADVSIDEMAYWDVRLDTPTMKAYAENLTNKIAVISE